jgi:hypothetical protein
MINPCSLALLFVLTLCTHAHAHTMSVWHDHGPYFENSHNTPVRFTVGAPPKIVGGTPSAKLTVNRVTAEAIKVKCADSRSTITRPAVALGPRGTTISRGPAVSCAWYTPAHCVIWLPRIGEKLKLGATTLIVNGGVHEQMRQSEIAHCRA